MARTVERPNRYFTYLRRLRADGRSNMYGAIPYLAAAFGIDRTESFRIVCEWIDAQEALAGEPAVPKAIVPKAAIPAGRAAAPTLFDPLPGRKPADPPREMAAPRKARQPVKQRAQKNPDAAVPKKSRRSSDSQAA